MKKYTETILTLIMRQIVTGKTNLIRIEGVEAPSVYQAIAKALAVRYPDDLHAALSGEKYTQFREHAGAQDSQILDWFVAQGIVLNNDTLTYMRNQAANEPANHTSIYLLMGAEAVQDRGGLEDFTSIVTAELTAQLSADYSIWFKDTFDRYGFDHGYLKTIHTIYKAVFSVVAVDAMQLSRFVDQLDEMIFDSPRDILQTIYGSLDRYWHIPRIERRLRLDPDSKADMNLLHSAISFIQRKDDILRRLTSGKLSKQLTDYVEKYNIDRAAAFPTDSALFASFDAFATALRDYGAGKNQGILREKFIHIDYSIIADILGIKVETPTPKSGRVMLHGAPLEAYGQLIFDATERYGRLKEYYPNSLEIEVREIRLSQCSATDDDEGDTHSVASAYSEIVSMLGGIVRFLNAAHFANGESELEIRYFDDVDPFTMQAYYDQFSIITKPTRNWDDMCHIDFVVHFDADEEQVRYRWVFSPKAPWKKSFSLLDVDGNDLEAPALLVSDRLESCISCEDDDEFGAQLENCNPKNETKGQRKLISKFFDHYGIADKYNLLCANFTRWEATVKQWGFYNSTTDLGSVISSYGDMIGIAYTKFHNMTQEERSKLYLIADSFTVVDAQSILTNGTVRAAIVPAFHPLTLEKIAAQSNFIRDGYHDMYAQLRKGYPFGKILDELHTMAAVAGSLDAIVSTSHQYLSCQSMHGYHAVYLPREQEAAVLTSDNAIDSIISAEEGDADKTVPANSEILYRNVMDYIHTFSSRMDGLTLSLINPYDMHHVIAAMQVIDKKLQEEGAEAVINLNIICIDAQRNSSGYLKRWLDNFFAEEKHIHINTYLRYGFFESDGRVAHLDDMLSGTDICFIYDLMKMQTIAFKRMSTKSGDDSDTVQFPMVTIPDVISQSAGQQRSISNSQFQFRNSRIYTQFIHVIGYPDSAEGTYRTMFALEMPERIMRLLDTAHKFSRWTVCIDKAIDRDLIQNRGNKIIGFSTGDGDFGDLNVTVSAQADILDDIQGLLERKLFERFPGWNQAKRQAAAKFCIESSNKTDGIRVLKALNPNDYNIHSYLAYILTLQSLLQEKASDSVQYVLVNLDAYMHWFDRSKIGSISDSESRPDLLLLDIPKTDDLADPDKPLHIRARVIECKMGNESVSQLMNAKEQVVHGYEVLKNNWNPDSTSMMRRYWFNQLYRVLVFSKLSIRDNEETYAAVEQKLQDILDGKFDIEWECAVYAYWLNQDGSEPAVYVSNQDGVDVSMHVAGQLYIQKMLMPEERRNEAVHFEVQPEEKPVDLTQDEDSDGTPEGIPEIQIDIPVTPNPSEIEVPESPAEPESTEPAGETREDPITPPAPESVVTIEDSNQDDFRDIPTPECPNRDISSVRMRLGEDIHTRTSFYWEFGHKELNNRHLLINGNSGCGKTYAIQTLLMEQAQQGISSVIFDYTAGFTATKLDPSFREALGGRIQQRVVRQKKLAVNPFQKHDIKIDEDLYIPEDNTDIATKIANIFQKVYGFGDQQKSTIYTAIMNGLKKHGDLMSFAHMAEELEAIGNKTAESVLSKIRPFIDLDPFTLEEPFDWGTIRDSEGIVYIIQLTGYSSDVKLLLTEILLWDIWSYCEKNGDESKPFTVVLDEAQNLDHSAASPSAKILTEGRKFGLSGWYATQFMKPQLSDDEIQRLQQAGQKLYFCPPDEGVMTVAKNIDITSAGSKAWAERLKKLKKGECVTCGGMVQNGRFVKYEPRIIKITSFQERLK